MTTIPQPRPNDRAMQAQFPERPMDPSDIDPETGEEYGVGEDECAICPPGGQRIEGTP